MLRAPCSGEFDEDALALWNFENSVEQYASLGGTSRLSVQHQIDCLRTELLNA